MKRKSSRKRKIRYSEGDFFSVPLGMQRFVLGVVARTDRSDAVIAYFFGPAVTHPPSLRSVANLTASDAVLIAKIGNPGMLDGRWPLVGRVPLWERAEWPMPSFVRRDVINGTPSKVIYTDGDLLTEVAIQPCQPGEAQTLPEDGAYGYLALEETLRRRLLAGEGGRGNGRSE